VILSCQILLSCRGEREAPRTVATGEVSRHDLIDLIEGQPVQHTRVDSRDYCMQCKHICILKEEAVMESRLVARLHQQRGVSAVSLH
jgi:hypothetical protein